MDVEVSTRRVRQDLERLKEFTATPGRGCSRLPFTPETRAAAAYLKTVMEQAGLQTWQDAAGNLFGLLPGQDRQQPCVLCGSHYDSVYNGGDYDGIAGVVCAIELARILQDEGRTLSADYIAAAFMDEEGCRFGTGYFGSKTMLGQLAPGDCERFADKDGLTVAQAMRGYGLDPGALPGAAWPQGRIGHYIELHIEQGPVLEAKGIELGLVEGIVGLQRYSITVNGQADHAGTTPMNMRRDAVDMAAKVIAQVGDMARAEGGGAVATVGLVRTEPGAVNIVAQRVEFTLDVRSVEEAAIDRIVRQVRARLTEETQRAGGSFQMDEKLAITPVRLSPAMLDKMEASCRRRGYSCMRLPSGAGHDALAIGQSVDTVMLFVPSQGGRSHCPEEYTPPEAFGKATAVLYDLVLGL